MTSVRWLTSFNHVPKPNPFRCVQGQVCFSFFFKNMAAQADAKAQKALGENAATLVGIGKEAFETETPGIIKTVYEAEISGV